MKTTKTTPPKPPRKDLTAFRATLEAELIGRKEARRAAEDYNPAIILMSPFEDEGLVLAQYRREHPDLEDYELIAYGIVTPRPELCSAASRAAGAAWQAETSARAKQAVQEAAEKFRREAPAGGPVSEPTPDLQEPGRTEQARGEEPVKEATPPPEAAPKPRDGFNSWSTGRHSWLLR
jgi:hypothetical protein